MTDPQEEPQGFWRSHFVPGPDFWHRHVSHRFKMPNLKERRAFLVVTKWDSAVYLLLVTFGLPFEAHFVTDWNLKYLIFMCFFAFTAAYVIIEIAEMIVPVLRDKVVNEKNAHVQIDSTQLLKNWGAQGAAVIWALALVGYIGFKWPGTGWWDNTVFLIRAPIWDTPVWYGPLEIFVIIHTYFMAKYSTRFLNDLLFVLLKAFPRAERIEDEAPPRH